MKRAILFGLALLCLVASASAVAGFDDDFTGAVLRVDYRHTGTSVEEHFALDRMIVEGPWPGSRTQMIDTTNLGKYMVELADLATHQVLYSRGFASIYGEWETTGEAREGFWRAIEEAVRVPEPRRACQLRIRKRQADQSFREIWSLTIDPASRFVDRPGAPSGEVRAVIENGDPATKVDLVILGDGYAAHEMEKYAADVRRAADALFALDPFKSRREDFNVWAVNTPAERSGVSRPRSGVYRDSPLGARYNSFDSERYVLSLTDRRWRDAAAAAPYDFVLMLVNERKYGGGGIYGLYSTAAADSSYAPYLVVHEFGHHFAGLGDEYYTSPTAYEEFVGGKIEPWEPNVTALPGRIGDSAADTLGEGSLRKGFPGKPEAAGETAGRRGGGVGARGAVRRGAREVHADARRRAPRGQGRGVRGRDVRGPGALPSLGRLHHVHPGRRRFLSCLLPGDRAGDRPLRALRRASLPRPISPRATPAA
jgi:hypothetical protein